MCMRAVSCAASQTVFLLRIPNSVTKAEKVVWLRETRSTDWYNLIANETCTNNIKGDCEESELEVVVHPSCKDVALFYLL